MHVYLCAYVIYACAYMCLMCVCMQILLHSIWPAFSSSHLVFRTIIAHFWRSVKQLWDADLASKFNFMTGISCIFSSFPHIQSFEWWKDSGLFYGMKQELNMDSSFILAPYEQGAMALGDWPHPDTLGSPIPHIGLSQRKKMALEGWKCVL